MIEGGHTYAWVKGGSLIVQPFSVYTTEMKGLQCLDFSPVFPSLDRLENDRL